MAKQEARSGYVNEKVVQDLHLERGLTVTEIKRELGIGRKTAINLLGDKKMSRSECNDVREQYLREQAREIFDEEAMERRLDEWSEEEENELHPNCKFSVKEAAEMKWLFQNTELSANRIQEVYDIYQGSLYKLRDGELLDDLEPSKPDEIPEPTTKANLTPQKAAEVKWLARNTDWSYKQIANKYSTTRSNTCTINRERSWKDLNPRKPKWYDEDTEKQ